MLKNPWGTRIQSGFSFIFISLLSLFIYIYIYLDFNYDANLHLVFYLIVPGDCCVE